MTAYAGARLDCQRVPGWIYKPSWYLPLLILSGALVPLPFLVAWSAQSSGWLQRQQAIDLVNIAVGARIGGPTLNHQPLEAGMLFALFLIAWIAKTIGEFRQNRGAAGAPRQHGSVLPLFPASPHAGGSGVHPTVRRPELLRGGVERLADASLLRSLPVLAAEVGCVNAPGWNVPPPICVQASR
jgi:hypothetical protein